MYLELVVAEFIDIVTSCQFLVLIVAVIKSQIVCISRKEPVLKLIPAIDLNAAFQLAASVIQAQIAWQASYRDGIRRASCTCHSIVQCRSGSAACTISAIRGAVSGYEPGRTGTISGEGSTVPETCSCRRGFSCAASDLSRKDRYECKPDF